MLLLTKLEILRNGPLFKQQLTLKNFESLLPYRALPLLARTFYLGVALASKAIIAWERCFCAAIRRGEERERGGQGVARLPSFLLFLKPVLHSQQKTVTLTEFAVTFKPLAKKRKNRLSMERDNE